MSSELDFSRRKPMQAETQSVDQRAFKNVIPVAIWTAAWVLTLAVVRFGPVLIWNSNPVAGWIALAANVAVGIGLILMYVRYLQRLDELQRKIQVDAMALALGVGVVGGIAYAAANSIGLIALEGNIAIFSALMAVVYSIATVVGTIRYR
jgi:hypothetical protein